MCESAERVLRAYLHRYLGRNEDTWELRPSGSGGRGLFTTRALDAGELIFHDRPVVLGPRAKVTEPQCASCHQPGRVSQCPDGCCLPVCSSACAKAPTHVRECRVVRESIDLPNWRLDLVGTVTPLRCLFLDAEDRQVVKCLQGNEGKIHGVEVDLLKRYAQDRLREEDEAWMRQCCRAMDTNAFEVMRGSSLRGLYPLAAMMNNSCSPNSCHVYDGEAVMRVFAARPLKAGEEVTTAYSAILWSTTVRRLNLLRTKHFHCCCQRCQDPTEFGTFLSALPCRCRGQLLPTDPLQALSPWTCDSCGVQLSAQDAARLQAAQGTLLQRLCTADPLAMVRFIRNPPLGLQQICVQLQNSLVWSLGHNNGYMWAELSDELLEVKERCCRALLELLEALRLGLSRMRGLLLLELHATLCEASRRHSQDAVDVCQSLVAEARTILQYDDDAKDQLASREREQLDMMASSATESMDLPTSPPSSLSSSSPSSLSSSPPHL